MVVMGKDVDVEMVNKERAVVEAKRMNGKVGMMFMKERVVAKGAVEEEEVVMKEEPVSKEEEVAVVEEELATTGKWAALMSKRMEVQQRVE